MADVIKTRYDDELYNDVILEQIDGKDPAVATTLKNAENIYKSFLYLKKMYTGGLSSGKVVKMGTITSAGAYVDVTLLEDTTTLKVSNVSAANSAFIELNGEEYQMQPLEQITLPLVAPVPLAVPAVAGDALRLKGDTVSYILLIDEV